MSKFFINRPNVAIVIALLTLHAGLVAMTKLSIPNCLISSLHDQRIGDVHRRRRSDH